MQILDEATIKQALGDLPGWSRVGDQLVKTFIRDDFRSAMLFVERVAAAADAVDHHLDVSVHANTVTIALTSEMAGTLTSDEIALARRTQRLTGDHHHPIGLAGP
jgi:4a-hydroxytetrahydrobiopterin dehydratase